jgi:hypothetical protein
MENIEFYKFNRNYYMHNINNGVEGKVILGYGNHGGEVYAYVSHVEFDFELDDFTYELYKDYAYDHIDEILDAREL